MENINNSTAEQSNDSNVDFDSLYLSKLKFKPELRKTWLNFFVTRYKVVFMMIVILFSWGAYAFFSLPRESNPEVKIPIGIVVTTYPGASPTDIEELVTKKIETGVASLQGIDKITATSYNSLSVVSVQFLASEDLESALRRLRDKVTTIVKDLPEDASEPVVNEVSFDDQPILTMVLSGPYDGLILRKYADDLKDPIEKIPGVREVKISGGDEREFEIAYDPNILSAYGLTLDQANQVVKASNLVFPSGTYKDAEYNYPVRSDGRFFTAKELGDLPIITSGEGKTIFLKDIASVQEKKIERTIYSRLSVKGSIPQDAVTISIVKRTGGSIIESADAVKKIIADFVSKMPPGLKYDTTVDVSDRINRDFNQLTHDFTLTIVLVFGLLFLIVGLKEAFVAALAVPLVFAVTFGIMMLTGISLNFLSLFSLILSLGLLVDDAIVVVSATKQYLRSGKFTPEEAVLLVLEDFKVVLTTTTLTTVWAFLPLLVASGIIGQFIKSIPITVSVTLISSLLIALMINHPLAAYLERIRLTRFYFFSALFTLLFVGIYYPLTSHSVVSYIFGFLCFIIILKLFISYYFRGLKEQLLENERMVEEEWLNDDKIKKKLREQTSSDHESLAVRLMHGLISFKLVMPLYEVILRGIMKTRFTRLLTLFFTFIVFSASIALPITGIVKTEFFPASDAELLFIQVEARTGLNIKETDLIVKKVEKKLLNYQEIANFTTIVGLPSSGSNSAGAISKESSHIASITIKLVEKENRNIKSYELADKIRPTLSDITEANVTVESQAGGPPAGSAFEARIRGEDLKVLDKISKDLKLLLVSVPGVINADTSFKEAPAELTFSLKHDLLNFYNLSAVSVSSFLRTAVNGTEVTKIIRDGKEFKVIARLDQTKIPRLGDLQDLQIINFRGKPVTLKDVATIELKPSLEYISRIDQKRTVLLSASVAGGVASKQVLQDFQDLLSKKYQLPEGYDIIYGGENEENAKSVQSILQAMIISAALIIATLLIQFNSLRKTLIVLVTIPLALIGVFFGLAILGVPLSFPGLIGVLALFGIVVKNAIILVDKINLNLQFGIDFVEAIIDACKSRLEAIIITSAATIFGILPITLSNETWTALGAAIICGLLLSSFLTLFIVPILFRTFIGENERIV